MPRASALALAAVCIGAFMGQLDASIVTLALPALGSSFHASVAVVSWVGLSYLLVLVATVAVAGRLADMVGRKLLYIYGFAVFIVGSGLCALAPSLLALDACRALQAVGAAMLQANSVAIIALAVPRPRLGRALGIQGAAQAFGLAAGPSVGGLLLAAGGWRLLFLINVPVGLVGVVAAFVFIPRSGHLQQHVAFDWRGLGLFFPAVVSFVFAVSEGNHVGWTSPVIVSAIGVAFVLGGAFVLWECRCRAPLVDMSLFRRPQFAAGVSSSVLAFLVTFGVLVVVPFALERGGGYGAIRTGLELMVLPVALGLTAPLSGRMADRFGISRLTGTGMVLVALGLAGLSRLGPTTGGFVGALVIVGAGLGLFLAPNNAGIMASVPPHQSGIASGLLNMSRGLGTALGLAVTGAVFTFLGGDGAATEVRRAFSGTVLVLAGVALVAAVVSAIGSRRPERGRRGSPFSPAQTTAQAGSDPSLRSVRAPGGERRVPPAGRSPLR
jgi:EmrB/QacA subfamily drug resistance transporter